MMQVPDPQHLLSSCMIFLLMMKLNEGEWAVPNTQYDDRHHSFRQGGASHVWYCAQSPERATVEKKRV
jgi:hypothetical protein